MAYSTPKDLDGFIPHLSKADTKFRQQLGSDLLQYLTEPSNPVVCQDLGLLIDGLIPWMQSSNYKLSCTGIEIMTYLIDRLATDFRPYLQTVLPNVIDRLGDAKDTVRENAQLLILKLLERNVLQPATLLEKLQPGFSHKNAKIREEVLRCLVNTINEHGVQNLNLSKYTPDIAKLLSDPTASVRDTAFNTIVDLYKHVGDKLRMDLQKRNLVPQSKWPALSAQFDEVKEKGDFQSGARSSDYCLDEVDRTVMHKPVIPVKKPHLGSALKARTITPSTNSVLSRVGSVRKLQNSSGPAGSVDEDTFMKSFEDVPPVRIFSPREISDHMKSILDTISDTNKDWNKRVDALKKIRAIIIADGINYEEFHIGLKTLELPLQATLKDLRSQVVREACITIAYLAQTLRNKFERTAEMLMPPLISLIQNSAKIMSTSGIVTVKYIIRNIHYPRLIPIVTSNLATSKSKEIRRYCCDFLDYILNNWPSHSLEKHVAALQEACKKGIADADPEARVSSRKAFRGFREHFPEQAEALLQSLDPSYRRALQGDGMSASSSNNNLTSGFKSSRGYARGGVTTPHSATGSTENLSGTGSGLQRAPSLPRSYRNRSGIPVLSRDNSARKGGFRSNSAIDLQAAQRAKARAQYAAMSRNKITSGTASLQGEIAQQARPRKSLDTIANPSPERLGRTRNRNSQSQPTSRSGSPSSRLAYLYNRSTDHDSPRPRRLSGGHRSTTGSREASRETSPNRGTLGRFRNRGNERPPLSPASRPVLAQKILQQSREAENALADAFIDGDGYRTPRKPLRSMDHNSDESETSSVCSERSFDSFKRPSDSYSWSGSQQRLAGRELWEPCRDINEILALCASTTWQERKDGLMSLQFYLANENILTPGELKYLCEIFTKMFMDSHTKGLSVFLDTLHEVIKTHKNELHSWTYVLMQRIFLKLGSEILTSVCTKLMTTLDVIKHSFPTPLLISNVYRFLVDATQTPNTKVKTVVLHYLTSLFHKEDGGQGVGTPPASQALIKIITMTQDMKSTELRAAAKDCIAAMWNCNTSQVTIMLAELPKELQDLARNVVQSHMRKNSTGSEPGSPMISASPKALSPGTPTHRTDGLETQEEIYRSLRKTTAEIQNYSYETLGNKLDRDRDTTSQDSGISQMSVGNDVKNDIVNLEERMEDLSIKPLHSRSGARSLPSYTAVNGVVDNTSNGFKSLGDLKDEDLIKTIFEKCVADHPSPITEKRELLERLLEIIKQGHNEYVLQNFKKLLRLLIEKLNEKDTQSQFIALEILAAIFQCEEMRPYWQNFVELLTLRVLRAHCNENREVVKAAEQTAAAMSVCPFSTIISTLAPIIQTLDYPEVLGAIKMLTKVIETNPHEVKDEHLAQIMPGLINASDFRESPVRKSSIFCMVAIHKAVGEQRLEPFTAQLSGSKMKLLRLYISRSQQTTSVPTSPKNTAS